MCSPVAGSRRAQVCLCFAPCQRVQHASLHILTCQIWRTVTGIKINHHGIVTDKFTLLTCAKPSNSNATFLSDDKFHNYSSHQQLCIVYPVPKSPHNTAAFTCVYVDLHVRALSEQKQRLR